MKKKAASLVLRATHDTASAGKLLAPANLSLSSKAFGSDKPVIIPFIMQRLVVSDYGIMAPTVPKSWFLQARAVGVLIENCWDYISVLSFG